jgi:hypothetical protein
MRNTPRIVWLIVALAIAVSRQCVAASAQESKSRPDVWTLPGLERALRDTPAGQNKKAVVHVARNEWESFQIALRGAAPVRITDVAVGPLRGPLGAALPADYVPPGAQH